MKKKAPRPDDPIELMNIHDVCAYTLLSRSSVDKRARNPDDDFPSPEWLGRKRVWRAKAIREFVFNSLTSVAPDHHLAADPAPSDDMDSLKFGDAGGQR